MGTRRVRAALHGEPELLGDLRDSGLCRGPPCGPPPPSVEFLLRRLRVTAQPVLRFPTEAGSQGPQRGMPPVARPLGPA